MDAPSPASDPVELRRVTENAFYVLGLPLGADAKRVDRTVAKLLAALDRGEPQAQRYATPVGPRRRDAAQVRGAAASLLDPDARIQHELWAALPTQPRAARPEAWPAAMRAFGWSRVDPAGGGS